LTLWLGLGMVPLAEAAASPTLAASPTAGPVGTKVAIHPSSPCPPAPAGAGRWVGLVELDHALGGSAHNDFVLAAKLQAAVAPPGGVARPLQSVKVRHFTHRL
jgi:hypothetical protein